MHALALTFASLSLLIGAAPPPAPASAAWKTLQQDPEPAELAADEHFPTSNEHQHHLWRETLEAAGPGGVFIGVGTDQNYLMAAWQRPDALVLMDFDQVVVDLHLAYRAIFRAAPDTATFRAYWKAGKRKDVVALLEKELAEPDRKRVIKSFRSYQPNVEARIAQLVERYGGLKVKTFLDDEEQYAFLRKLFDEERVVAVRGDLTGDKSVLSIAAAAQAVGAPVRVLYLSNAERYFPWGESYKRNMAALPFDERSVVLRTAGLGSSKTIDPYFYLVQSGGDFQTWLKESGLGDVAGMLKKRRPLQKRFLYGVDAWRKPS